MVINSMMILKMVHIKKKKKKKRKILKKPPKNSKSIYFFPQYLKAIAPLSSGLYCFEWEVFYSILMFFLWLLLRYSYYWFKSNLIMKNIWHNFLRISYFGGLLILDMWLYNFLHIWEKTRLYFFKHSPSGAGTGCKLICLKLPDNLMIFHSCFFTGLVCVCVSFWVTSMTIFSTLLIFSYGV